MSTTTSHPYRHDPQQEGNYVSSLSRRSTLSVYGLRPTGQEILDGGHAIGNVAFAIKFDTSRVFGSGIQGDVSLISRVV